MVPKFSRWALQGLYKRKAISREEEGYVMAVGGQEQCEVGPQTRNEYHSSEPKMSRTKITLLESPEGASSANILILTLQTLFKFLTPEL